MGLERLVGLGGEIMRLSRFLVNGMRGWCGGFTSVGVSLVAGRGNVVDLSMCMARALLPPGSLLIVEALCGVGENRTGQSWCGHGWDADGGSHS